MVNRLTRCHEIIGIEMCFDFRANNNKGLHWPVFNPATVFIWAEGPAFQLP
jgi:hypothetical protein